MIVLRGKEREREREKSEQYKLFLKTKFGCEKEKVPNLISNWNRQNSLCGDDGLGRGSHYQPASFNLPIAVSYSGVIKYKITEPSLSNTL